MNHTLWIQFLPGEIFNLNAGSLWESVNCFCSIMHRTPSFFFLITEVSGRAVMQALIFNLTDHHAFIFPFDKSAISTPRHAWNVKREREQQSNGGVCAAISADQAANLAPPDIPSPFLIFNSLRREKQPKGRKLVFNNIRGKTTRKTLVLLNTFSKLGYQA